MSLFPVTFADWRQLALVWAPRLEEMQSRLDALRDDIGITIDGGGAVIALGSHGYRYISQACRIKAWALLSDIAGSCVIDVRRADAAAFPSTVSIAGTEKPTLVTAQSATNTSIRSWGPDLSVGDRLEFVVESAAVLTRVSLILVVSRI